MSAEVESVKSDILEQMQAKIGAFPVNDLIISGTVKGTPMFFCITKNRNLYGYKKSEELKLYGEIKQVKVSNKTIKIRHNPAVSKDAEGINKLTVADVTQADIEAFCNAYNEVKISVSETGAKETITVWSCTWNMANKSDIPKEYIDMLTDAVKQSPDVIFIGAQESKSDKAQIEFLTTHLDQMDYKHLFSRWNKMQKEEEGWGSLKMAIFIKKSLWTSVGSVIRDDSSVGIPGLKNKGAVVTATTIHGSPVCFVVSHLAAHLQYCDRRDKNYADIVADLDFASCNRGYDGLFAKYHHVIWIGDLNYRIEYRDDEVRRRIARQMWPELLKYDQLKQHQKEGLVFQDFAEGEIKFAPTFKFKKENDKYTDSYSDQRIPAWCDRVLVKSYPCLEAKCLQYGRGEEVRSSDHKPVFALWELKVLASGPPKPPIFASLIAPRPRVRFESITIELAEGYKQFRMKVNLTATFTKQVIEAGNVAWQNEPIVMKGEDLPELLPDQWTNLEYMKTQYLRVSFIRENVGVGLSIGENKLPINLSRDNNKVFGAAVIPLCNVMDDCADITHEKVKILRDSVCVGTISVKFKICLVSHEEI